VRDAAGEGEDAGGDFTQSGFMAVAAPLPGVSDKVHVAARNLRFAKSVSIIDTKSLRRQPSAAKWA
jgi:hypothetical protein